MKRILLLISFALALTACGKSELDKFADSFNEAAEGKEIKELDTESFGNIDKENDSDRGWQVLYGDDNYTMDAKYEDGESLSGYYLVIDKNQPFIDESGEGYEAALSIIEALELSEIKFKTEYRKALKENSHAYDDERYIISFANPGSDGLTSVGLIINFDKK